MGRRTSRAAQPDRPTPASELLAGDPFVEPPGDTAATDRAAPAEAIDRDPAGSGWKVCFTREPLALCLAARSWAICLARR